LKDEIKEIFEQSNVVMNPKTPKNVLCLGADSTGKTGSVISMLLQDMSEDEKIIVIDIDNSALEIIKEFNFDSYQKDMIKHYNPYATMVNAKGVSVIDHQGLVDNLRSAAQAISELSDEGMKIRAIIIDGISFLLESCENLMREEKNIAPDSGANTQFWKIRAKNFRECTEVFLQLPIDCFFIGHDDFIRQPDDEKFASVKQRLHSSCSHRLIYSKEQDEKNPHVINFIAMMDKDRSNILNIKKKVVFATVNNKLNKYVWDAGKINSLFSNIPNEDDGENDDE
jgi:hypothetical protein